MVEDTQIATTPGSWILAKLQHQMHRDLKERDYKNGTMTIFDDTNVSMPGSNGVPLKPGYLSPRDGTTVLDIPDVNGMALAGCIMDSQAALSSDLMTTSPTP